MNLYEDQFSTSHDFPRVDKPAKTLVIASTPRCGSHMLGHALRATSSFGFPLEYANAANFAEWKRRLGLANLAEVLNELQQRRTSPNGVFGIKLHYTHIAQFGGFENVASCFPNAHYILLSRKDALRQAVSLSIAAQTGVWISGQQPVNANPAYRFQDVDASLRRVLIENASWRYVLAASGSKYMELDFDDVRLDLRATIEAIATFMDVGMDEKSIPPQQVTKKQSDDLNAKWMAQYVADFDSTRELSEGMRFDPLKRVKSRIKRVMQAAVSQR